MTGKSCLFYLDGVDVRLWPPHDDLVGHPRPLVDVLEVLEAVLRVGDLVALGVYRHEADPHGLGHRGQGQGQAEESPDVGSLGDLHCVASVV